MNDTAQIDFYDLNGNWCDACEAWQLEGVLPVLRVLFGAVTWRKRDAVPAADVDLVADLVAWLNSDSVAEVAL